MFLHSLCWFSINNHSFLLPYQYGPFHIPENAPVGTTVTAVLAGDADVRGGDSWQVDYRLESGNEEEVFTLATDKQTNEVSLVLSRVNNRRLLTHQIPDESVNKSTTVNVTDNFQQGFLAQNRSHMHFN